jgi:hypothetical protein
MKNKSRKGIVLPTAIVCLPDAGADIFSRSSGIFVCDDYFLHQTRKGINQFHGKGEDIAD